ncbi:MAG: D-tyrosyl-tRNA(Tyr) deacylase [Parachlamydiales bacterium]|nr:D-tyrosyl-tRNA(Tyr) deacylase [Parachlamydiales bacterium]
MRAVIQRVKKASVEVDNKIVGSVNKGLLVFLACKKDDTVDMTKTLAEKIVNFRIFKDENEKMNLSTLDVNAEILVVSQFTLYADTKKGRRPAFINLMEPKKANEMYEEFIKDIKGFNVKVQTGIFAADMQVSLINDGPVTFIIEV